MKPILFFLAACWLVSCTPFGDNPLGYNEHNDELQTAWKLVASQEYQKETDTFDYWKSPTEFFSDGGGDCEDYAIALLYLLGPSADMAVVIYDCKFHACVKYDGEYLNPQYEGQYHDPSELIFIWTFSYAYVMHVATDSGTKNLN